MDSLGDILDAKEAMEEKWKEYVAENLTLLLHQLQTLNQEILKMKEKLGKNG